jgi:hypothetical protein
MNERKILIELLDMVTARFRFDSWENTDKIADHLLANGVIAPPCKIGEPVYIAIKKTSRHCKAYAYVRKSKLTYKNMARVISDFGKTVFLSKEEAERVANGREEAD